ncbi:MAG: CHAT domain-containing protein, partial [Bacteroidetes bacterium]|nr:CHAT domain-containing protein [Bacteroidota bacterium]
NLKLNRNDSKIIDLYNDIGNGLSFLGRYDQAENYFSRGYEKAKNLSGSEANRKEIETLTFLGMIYMVQGKPDKSLSYLQKANTLANRSLYYTNLVNFNLGRVYTKKKNWPKAISHLAKAEQLFQQEYGANHHHTIITQRRIAEVYAEMDSLNQSLAYAGKALKSLYPDFNLETQFDNPTLENFSAYTLLLPILEVKGSVLKKMYREKTESLKKVLHTYDLAAKTIDYIRETQASEASKLVLSTNARQTYEGAIEILGHLFQKTGEKTYLEQAFTYMEKSRSLVLLENVRKYKEIQLNLEPQLAGDSVFHGLLASEKFLKREQVFYEKKLAEAQFDNDSARIASLEKSLAEFYLEQQNLQTQFKDKYPTYYQVNYHTEVAGIHQIQSKLLSSNQALIEYFPGEKAMYVIRITRKKADFFHLPYHNDLDKLITQYRAAMVGEMYIQSPEKEFQQYTESAYALYQALLAPVLAELPDHIQHLYLIPDGKLNYISFESLLSQMPTTDHIDYSINHLDYLIKNKMISYGYSSTLLIEALSPSPEKKKLKSYAGFAPVFAQNALATERNCLNADDLEFLPNTEISVQNTHKLLGGKLFLREDASKDNFISNASDYHILHLSTHACVDAEDPLFNRIFFARDHLSAYEIYNLNLSADLVVLSACETGFGNITQGEGVMSLARSFLYAGSKSIITSLWNADDYATTEIMLSFHKYLTEGKTKAQALHQAKMDYLTKNSPRLSPPYYWSNFVLVGNADSVEFSSFSRKYVYLGIMLLILLGVIFFYFSNRKK